MNNPFVIYDGHRTRRAESVEDRLEAINDMDRDELNAGLAVADLQPKVKSAIVRRLKQFDEWGYEGVIALNNGKPDRKFHKQGNERQVRRWALLQSNSRGVVELSAPITREQWLAYYGNGKTRM